MLFPAYAGVILADVFIMLVQLSFPRIRGGDPYKQYLEWEKEDFSPHTRG